MSVCRIRKNDSEANAEDDQQVEIAAVALSDVPLACDQEGADRAAVELDNLVLAAATKADNPAAIDIAATI